MATAPADGALAWSALVEVTGNTKEELMKLGFTDDYANRLEAAGYTAAVLLKIASHERLEKVGLKPAHADYVYSKGGTAERVAVRAERAAERAEQAAELAARKRLRTEDDSGVTAGTVSVSVMGADEGQLWKECVTQKNIPCQIVPVTSLLPQPRMVLAALRWLVLLAVHAPCCFLKEHFAGRNASHEVLWHAPLLYIYQAAASGQPDISFEAEDKSMQDSAREDLRGIVRGTSCVPQEVKREYGIANSSPATGIHKNRAGFAKLLKCICAKYHDRCEHLVTLASRMEAVWIARFNFRQPEPQQLQGQSQQDDRQPVPQRCAAYHTLTSVDVAPAFPNSKDEVPSGVICKGIHQTVQELLASPSSTLADLLARASAGSSTAPPPGFVLLVQYVDQLCHMFEIQRAIPMAVYSSSISGAQDAQEEDLSEAIVVHLGRKSLVLRLPGADSVIKVAATRTIHHELAIHRVIDSQGSPSLRASAGLCHGLISGVGDGLAFLQLQHWCQPVSGNQLVRDQLVHLFWNQAEAGVLQLHAMNIVHRDIKPANFLTHNNGAQLVLNDFDMACQSHDTEEMSRRPVGTLAFWSPRCDVEIPGWHYAPEDDWMGLALTFASWLGVYQPALCSPRTRASVKLGVVSMLLSPGFEMMMPGSFRQRIQPVYDQVNGEVISAQRHSAG